MTLRKSRTRLNKSFDICSRAGSLSRLYTHFHFCYQHFPWGFLSFKSSVLRFLLSPISRSGSVSAAYNRPCRSTPTQLHANTYKLDTNVPHTHAKRGKYCGKLAKRMCVCNTTLAYFPHTHLPLLHACFITTAVVANRERRTDSIPFPNSAFIL